MSYNKETIKSGEVISSKWGNKVEDGIYNAHKDIEMISSKVGETDTKINTAQGKAESAYNLASAKQDKLTISSSTTSTSTTQVANSYAVKQAMDRANSAFQSASDGKGLIASAINSKDGSVSSFDSFYTLANAIKKLNASKSTKVENIDYNETMTYRPKGRSDIHSNKVRSFEKNWNVIIFISDKEYSSRKYCSKSYFDCNYDFGSGAEITDELKVTTGSSETSNYGFGISCTQSKYMDIPIFIIYSNGEKVVCSYVYTDRDSLNFSTTDLNISKGEAFNLYHESYSVYDHSKKINAQLCLKGTFYII